MHAWNKLPEEGVGKGIMVKFKRHFDSKVCERYKLNSGKLDLLRYKTRLAWIGY